VAAAFLLPLLAAAGPGGPDANRITVAATGNIFQPQQAFWFAGATGHVVRGTFGDLKPGYRTPPAWLGGLAHPLIVALALPLTLLCLRRRPPGRELGDALLLLALLGLLRCVLDPWDAVYYPLPFVLALLGWETLTRRRPPVLALAASAAVWWIFVWLPDHASADVTSAAARALARPAAVALAAALYRRPRPQALPARERRAVPALSPRPAVPS
jgi:hypothetical protein